MFDSKLYEWSKYVRATWTTWGERLDEQTSVHIFV